MYCSPKWSDSEVTVNERNIQAFTKSGKKLKTEVTVGNNKKGKHVEFALFFPKPLETGEKYEFKYSYVTPRTYKEGEEYFEWYFGQPHYQYLIDMKFDPLWYIENPVIYCDQDKDWFKINKISAQHFKWRRPFPKIGSTYRINFRLKKTTT